MTLPTPTTVRELIELWPTRPALARLLSVSNRQVVGWHERGSIPEAKWEALVDLAARLGFEGVTYAFLAALHRAPLVNEGPGAVPDFSIPYPT